MKPTSALTTNERRVAFAWGLAEATFFFIVPDVLLTRFALKDFRSAWTACLWALAGALTGGIALHQAACHGLVPFLPDAFDWIPGISPAMIGGTAEALRQQGFAALAGGALAGQPYKLFATHAGAQGLPLLPFIAASAAARLGRFLITAALAWAVGRGLARYPEAFRMRLHLAVWILFYAFYFFRMRG